LHSIASAQGRVGPSELAYSAPAGGGGGVSTNPVHVAFNVSNDLGATAWDFQCRAADNSTTTTCAVGVVYNAAEAVNHFRCDCAVVVGSGGEVLTDVYIRATSGGGGGMVWDSAIVSVNASLAYGALELVQPAAGADGGVAAVVDPVRVRWVASGALPAKTAVTAFCTGDNPTDGWHRVACSGADKVLVGAGGLNCDCLSQLAGVMPHLGPGTNVSLEVVVADDATISAVSPNVSIVASYAEMLPYPMAAAAAAGVPFNASVWVAASANDALAPTRLPLDLDVVIVAASAGMASYGVGGSGRCAAVGECVIRVTVPPAVPAGNYLLQYVDAADATHTATSGAVYVNAATPSPSPPVSYGYSIAPTLPTSHSHTPLATPSPTGTPTCTPTASGATRSPLAIPTPSPAASPAADGDVTFYLPPPATTYYSYGIPVAWVPSARLVNTSAVLTVWCTVSYASGNAGAILDVTVSGGLPTTAAAAIGAIMLPCAPTTSVTTGLYATVYVQAPGGLTAHASSAVPLSVAVDQPRLYTFATAPAGSALDIRTGGRVAITWHASPTVYAADATRYGTLELWRGGRQVAVLAMQVDLASQAATVDIPATAALLPLATASDYTLRLHSDGDAYACATITAPFTLVVEPLPSPSGVPTTTPAASATTVFGWSPMASIIVVAVGVIVLFGAAVCCIAWCRNKRAHKEAAAERRAVRPSKRDGSGAKHGGGEVGNLVSSTNPLHRGGRVAAGAARGAAASPFTADPRRATANNGMRSAYGRRIDLPKRRPGSQRGGSDSDDSGDGSGNDSEGEEYDDDDEEEMEGGPQPAIVVPTLSFNPAALTMAMPPVATGTLPLFLLPPPTGSSSAPPVFAAAPSLSSFMYPSMLPPYGGAAGMGGVPPPAGAAGVPPPSSPLASATQPSMPARGTEPPTSPRSYGNNRIRRCSLDDDDDLGGARRTAPNFRLFPA